MYGIQFLVPIAKGSLFIEADVESEPFTDGLVKLEDDYNDKSIPFKVKNIEVEKPVEINKKTVADRIGVSVPWMTDTFIVTPVLCREYLEHCIMESFTLLATSAAS